MKYKKRIFPLTDTSRSYYSSGRFTYSIYM